MGKAVEGFGKKRTIPMNRLVSCLVLAIGLACGSIASAESWQDLFESKWFQSAKGRSMPYRLLKPEMVEPGKNYPLVLFLHGIGERGTNNSRQLMPGLDAFTNPRNRSQYPCFMVAPQCPVDDSWVPLTSLILRRSMCDQPAAALQLALELVDKLSGDLPVDKRRIYITGVSMGGFGVWDAISRQPDYFAAAVPICGGGDPAQMPKVKTLPIWAFHGEKDMTVSPGRTKSMIEALQSAGGLPKMTIYSGVGHVSWPRAYADPETMAWLFSQHK